jgi:hypothetical protein
VGVAQTGDWRSGSALRSHRRGHWFEPSIAHQLHSWSEALSGESRAARAGYGQTRRAEEFQAVEPCGSTTSVGSESAVSQSSITELASGQLTNSDNLIVILVQPDDMPESVVVHWPARPTVLDPRAFSAAADTAVKTFAAAVVKLAQLRRGW